MYIQNANEWNGIPALHHGEKSDSKWISDNKLKIWNDKKPKIKW